MTKFTMAALLLCDTKKELTKLLGTEVELFFEFEEKEVLTTDNVLKVVSKVCEISIPEIKGNSKTKVVVYARYACFYLMRNYLKMTLKSIGRFFEKDHSTVISGLDVIHREIHNQELNSIIFQCEKDFLQKINENQVQN